MTPYRLGDAFANGPLTTEVTKYAVAVPYDSAGPFTHAVSAHIHAAVVNARGEAYAWGCGSNDGRAGVQRFLQGPGGRPDLMKCYMMGPHRIGVADEEWWAHGPSLKGVRVLQLASGRTTMACIGVPVDACSSTCTTMDPTPTAAASAVT